MEQAHPNTTVSTFAIFVGKSLYGCGTQSWVKHAFRRAVVRLLRVVIPTEEFRPRGGTRFSAAEKTVVC
jgi:hypothetical protein